MNYEFQGINETNRWIALATVSVLLSTVILFLMAALTVVTLQYWKLRIRTKSTNEELQRCASCERNHTCPVSCYPSVNPSMSSPSKGINRKITLLLTYFLPFSE